MSKPLTIWIPGRPISFGRPATVDTGAGKRRGLTPARYRRWRQTAEQWVALQTRQPITEPTTLAITVHANGSLVTIGGEIHAPDRPTGRDETGRAFTLSGDLDNYTKAVLDALEHGGALNNDQLVHGLTASFDPVPARFSGRLPR